MPKKKQRTLMIVPGGYWMVVRRCNAKETAGGIVLPDDEAPKSEARWGRVIAVGQGDQVLARGEGDPRDYVPIPFEVDDLVAFRLDRAILCPTLGQDLHCVSFRDVIFALKNEDGFPLGDDAPSDPARGGN